jgi:hypothetical protein
LKLKGFFGKQQTDLGRFALWHCGFMLRTYADVIAALRARKDALGLSNAVLDEIAGLTDGYTDKALGPTQAKRPSTYNLLSLIGALGLAVQLVEDPDTKVQRRWTKRRDNLASDNGRISKAAVKKARPLVLAELARNGGLSWWASMSPEQRQAHIAKLNKARAAKLRQRSAVGPV